MFLGLLWILVGIALIVAFEAMHYARDARDRVRELEDTLARHTAALKNAVDRITPPE